MSALLVLLAPASWVLQPATGTAIRAAAELCVDEFERSRMAMPLLQRTPAVSKWVEGREALLTGPRPHALIVARRDDSAADDLVGCVELGLLPPPPEKDLGSAKGAALLDAAASPPPPASAGGEEAACYPYLANLAVVAAERGAGLGRELCVEAERCALDWGFDRMFIKVERSNFGARRLYDRLGYRLVFLQAVPADWNDRQETLLFLRKDLDRAAPA